MSAFSLVGLVAVSLHSLELLFAQYGYWILAVLVAGESAGLPLPGETSLLAGAYLAQQGHLSITLVIVTAALAAIVGDNIGYLVGRHAGRTILEKYGRVFRIRAPQLRLLDHYFAEHGAKTVFFGRWIALLRVGAALFAGSSRMPWPRFFFWNALGGTAWAFTMGMAGYLFATSIRTLDKAFGVFGIAALVIAIVLIVIFVRRAERRLVARADAETTAGGSESPATGTGDGQETTRDVGRDVGAISARARQRDVPPAA